MSKTPYWRREHHRLWLLRHEDESLADYDARVLKELEENYIGPDSVYIDTLINELDNKPGFSEGYRNWDNKRHEPKLAYGSTDSGVDYPQDAGQAKLEQQELRRQGRMLYQRGK